MTLPVFVLDTLSSLRVGQRVVLDGDEGRHAATVKRMQVGQWLTLTDGRGHWSDVEVVEVAKSTLTVELLGLDRALRHEPHVTVVQAIPKGDRGELAVEMLTEIDVDRIVPWAASRSVAVWKGDRATKGLTKWRTTARTAAKQARRAWFPEVTELATTAQVVELIATADLAVVLHEAADLPMAELSLDGVGSILVVVGPEGGISDEELALFAEARIVRLGPSVLRTSTAGVAAVAALLSRTDRWG